MRRYLVENSSSSVNFAPSIDQVALQNVDVSDNRHCTLHDYKFGLNVQKLLPSTLLSLQTLVLRWSVTEHFCAILAWSTE